MKQPGEYEEEQSRLEKSVRQLVPQRAFGQSRLAGGSSVTSA